MKDKPDMIPEKGRDTEGEQNRDKEHEENVISKDENDEQVLLRDLFLLCRAKLLVSLLLQQPDMKEVPEEMAGTGHYNSSRLLLNTWQWK